MSTNIINLVLEFAVESGKSTFKLDEVYSEFSKEATNDDLNALRHAKCLFDMKNDQTIVIRAKSSICRHYSRPSGCSQTNYNKTCKFFHICQEEIERGSCKNKLCVLNHTLNIDHNRAVLKLNNLEDVSIDLILQLMQQPSSNQSTRSSTNRYFNLLDMSSDTTITQLKTQTSSRTLEIDITDEYCLGANELLLQKYFSKMKQMNIEDAQFYPQFKKAYITYFDANIAQKIAERSFIEFGEMKFHVKLNHSQLQLYYKHILLVKNQYASMNFKDLEDLAKKLTNFHVHKILVHKTTSRDYILCFKSTIDFGSLKLKHLPIEYERVPKSNRAQLVDKLKRKLNEEAIRRFLCSKHCLDKLAKIEFDNTNSHTAFLIFKSLPDDRLFSENLNDIYEVTAVLNDYVQYAKKVSIRRPNDIVKELDKKLNILMSDDEWKKKFIKSLKEYDVNVIERPTSLLLKCALSYEQENLMNKWERCVRNQVNEILNEYELKEILINDKKYENILEDLQNYEKSLIFELDSSSQVIHLVGKTGDLNNFLIKLDQKHSIDIKDLLMPSLNVHGICLSKVDDLLSPLLKFVKEKFKLDRVFYDENERRVTAKGTNVSIDQAFTLINKYLNNIDAKLLESQSPDLLKYEENMIEIIEKVFIDKNIQCKIILMSNRDVSNQRPGIYLIYFKEFPGIDTCFLDLVERIEQVYSTCLATSEIDLNKNTQIVDNSDWKEFFNEKFINSPLKSSFVYHLRRKSNSCHLLLFGLKHVILDLTQNVRDFIQQHDKLNKKLNFSADEILYFKKIYPQIESKLKEYSKYLKIEFYSTIIEKNKYKDVSTHEACLLNCPHNLYHEVLEFLQNEYKNKRHSSVQFENLPGLSKLFELSNQEFKKDIYEIESSTNTFIDFAIEEIRDSSLIREVLKPQPNKDDECESSIRLMGSTLSIAVGDILQLQGDVIVNSIDSNLNLEHGSLSQKIYQKAGIHLKLEFKNKYPNGIKQGEVAVTSAGEMKNFKQIYHVIVGHYSRSNEDVLVKMLKSSITNCLKICHQNELRTIYFPTLGAGGYGYPSGLIAKIMFSTVIDYLTNYTNHFLNIKFIIFTGDAESKDAFKKEFNEKKLVIDRKLRDSSILLQKEPSIRLKVNLQIIGNHEKMVKTARDSLKSLINDKYIKTYQISRDLLIHMNQDNVAALTKKDENIEISLNDSCDLCLIGYRDDVSQAREDLMSKILKANTEFKLKLEKIENQVQWEWFCGKEWRSFNFYQMSLIECAYQEGQKRVKFVLKDNKMAEIYFNQGQFSMEFDSSAFYVKRSMRNEESKLPKTWSSMSDGELYKLDALDEGTQEFKQVSSSFSRRCGRILKIERIQNARLFQQYEIHKVFLRKKNNNNNNTNNENEKVLFHGTSNENIASICKFGFNRSFCGQHGVVYGKGVYFAVDSSYSHGYCSGQVRKMFQCRVLVGESIRGSSAMNVPPNRPNGEPYDSTCDETQSIFVCYNDNQCYPEYLITYS